jgi:hypothetical protein
MRWEGWFSFTLKYSFRDISATPDFYCEASLGRTAEYGYPPRGGWGTRVRSDAYVVRLS